MIHSRECTRKAPKCPSCSDAGAVVSRAATIGETCPLFFSPVGWESCESERTEQTWQTGVRGRGQGGPGTTPLTSSGECQFLEKPVCFAGPFSDPTFFPPPRELRQVTVEQSAGDSLPRLTILASWAISRSLDSSHGHVPSIYWHNWQRLGRVGLAQTNPLTRHTLSCKSTVHRAETPAG